ncbi:MAG: ribosome-recycling factor [Patescibacteria group bacterium]
MEIILNELEAKGQMILDSLKKALAAVRTTRPNAAIVEDLKTNYYDQMTSIKQLGTISVQPPREIVIQVWDKAAVPSVAKAIELSTLNLSANIDGQIIRIFLPELSQERRDELVKHINKVMEEHKIQMRHLRDETNRKVQTAFDGKELDEDGKFKTKEQIQKEVDELNGNMEKVLENKIREINE